MNAARIRFFAVRRQKFFNSADFFARPLPPLIASGTTRAPAAVGLPQRTDGMAQNVSEAECRPI
jgi:hypothetical protein